MGALLSVQGSALLLIDFQQRLMPAIAGSEKMIARGVRIAEAARLLDVPIRATVQNPVGLGPAVVELADHPHATLAKTAFSAVADPDFGSLLPDGCEEVVIAGCEAHVCVLQTALGLLERQFRVVVVADAVGSRDPADRAAAIARMERYGAETVTSEMVLFEWLRDSRNPRFRDVHKLLR